MYRSLKRWLSMTATRKPFAGMSNTGKRLFGSSSDFKCYAIEKATEVLGSNGEQVVSNHQVYVDGTVEFDLQDNIIFNGVDRPIKTITVYYRNGVADLKVLYL